MTQIGNVLRLKKIWQRSQRPHFGCLCQFPLLVLVFWHQINQWLKFWLSHFGIQPIAIPAHVLANKFGRPIFWHTHDLVAQILEPNQPIRLKMLVVMYWCMC